MWKGGVTSKAIMRRKRKRVRSVWAFEMIELVKLQINRTAEYETGR